MTFKDISYFDKKEDYLPILTAIVIVDAIGIVLSYANIIQSNFLRFWYKKFQLSAVIADVLIVFIIARYIYYYIFDEFSIINFIILMLILQITHDILFYIMITSIQKGSNKMIDVFKDYADEMSYYAIIGDSIMIIASVLIASYLANLDVNTNIIILIVSLYLLQFILYNY
jgi:hypothetical protein